MHSTFRHFLIFILLIAGLFSGSVTFATAEDDCKVKLLAGTLDCTNDTACQGTKICACQNFLTNLSGPLSCVNGATPCAGSIHPICIRPAVSSCGVGYASPGSGVDFTACSNAIAALINKYTSCNEVCYSGPATPTLDTSTGLFRLKNPKYDAALCAKCTATFASSTWCTEGNMAGLYCPFGACTCRNGCSACTDGVNIATNSPITAPDADKDGVPEIPAALLTQLGLSIKATDNCPGIANPKQTDLNNNNIGCQCDPNEICIETGNIPVCTDPKNPPPTDTDCDGVPWVTPSMLPTIQQTYPNFKNDNCPTTYNPTQFDWNKNNLGCACDSTEGDCPWQAPLCTIYRCPFGWVPGTYGSPGNAGPYLPTTPQTSPSLLH